MIHSPTLQKVMDEMLVFAEKKSFNLNVQKTKVMVFGKSPTDTCLKIKAGDGELENVKEFKLLGLWLDPKLTFNKHIEETVKKCYKRVYILRNLKAKGITQEILVTIYKQQIRSVLEYAAAAWFPVVNASQIAKLDRIQNICLKTIVSFDVRSEKLRTKLNIPDMYTRLQSLTDRFILKEDKVNKMSWFNENPAAEYLSKLRNPRLIQETQCTTSRHFNGPINYFKRRLNYLRNKEH